MSFKKTVMGQIVTFNYPKIPSQLTLETEVEVDCLNKNRRYLIKGILKERADVKDRTHLKVDVTSVEPQPKGKK